MTNLAVRLRELRIAKGMTQTQAANATNVTRAVISLYENDMRRPSPEMLVALARLYGVSTDYLLCMDSRRFVDVTDLTEREIAAVETMVDLLRSKKQKG